MNVFDYFRRVNGISLSTPLGGVGLQWDRYETEREIAKSVIAFLENRRVLYIQYSAEVPAHCLQSIDVIRKYLNGTITNLPISTNNISDLELCLREMQSSCKMAMTMCNADGLTTLGHNPPEKEEQEVDFFMGLVSLRSIFAFNLKRLSTTYKIPIKEDEINQIIKSYVR